MSVASVIKHVMTLDGAQYMQELRQTIAETKAAELAIRNESKAMGVITVSQDEVKKALASSTVETGNFSKELASAATTMKGFNALQTAYAQAMGGNVVGATKSATVAVKTLYAVMLANPFTVVIAAVAALAAATIMHFDKMIEKQKEVRKGMKDWGKEAEEISKRRDLEDRGDVVKAQVDSASESEAKSMLAGAEAGRNTMRDWGDREMAKKKAFVQKNGNADKFDADLLNSAIAAETEAQRKVQLLKDKLAEIADDRKKISDNIKGDAAGAGTSSANKAAAEAELEQKKLSDLAKMKIDFERKQNEDSLVNPAEKLNYRKTYLKDELAGLQGKPGADNEVARQKILADIYETEKSIKELKDAAAEKTAAEGKQRLEDEAKLALSGAVAEKEKVQGRLDAARADILNPGAAAKRNHEAAMAKTREELREKALMSGRSVEARAMNKELTDAKDWLKAANGNLDKALNNPNLPEDPAVAELKMIKTGINGLRSDLTGYLS